MTTEMLKIDLPKNQSSIIKVMGVGGGGGNAVNSMFRQGIRGVDFVVCNTDSQHLAISPVPNKIQLGVNLTQGMGAGSLPHVGREAALEDIERVKEILNVNTKMIFITAGMGGGTGTGAAPVIAATAKQMGILTVGIVTLPFSFEGRKRMQQAQEGIMEMKEQVDTLLLICNDKLRELYGNLPYSESLQKADNILTTAAKGIAEIITQTGSINVDFADVKTVMTNSGVAIMGNGVAEGEDRAQRAVEMALSSPLLNDNNIRGAKNVLLNITSGVDEILMDEISLIADYVQSEAGSNADIIWGLVKDESLGKKVNITLVATGFDNKKTELAYLQPTFTNRSTPSSQPKNVVVLEPFNQSHVLQDEVQSPSDDELRVSHPAIDKPDISKDLRSIRIRKSESTTSQSEMKEAGEFKRILQEPTLFPHDNFGPNPTDGLQDARKKEREERLKALSQKIRNPQGLIELETQPAFERRKVQLVNTPHSSESQVSRLSLSQEEDRQVQIKSNNAFLHDNVD